MVFYFGFDDKLVRQWRAKHTRIPRVDFFVFLDQISLSSF